MSQARQAEYAMELRLAAVGRGKREGGWGFGAEANAGSGELLAARKRIAKLERKVGQAETSPNFPTN